MREANGSQNPRRAVERGQLQKHVTKTISVSLRRMHSEVKSTPVCMGAATKSLRHSLAHRWTISKDRGWFSLIGVRTTPHGKHCSAAFCVVGRPCPTVSRNVVRGGSSGAKVALRSELVGFFLVGTSYLQDRHLPASY